jgi:hypothetical protein
MPAATDLSPNVGNYYLGKGIVYWLGQGETAWRDLGNCTIFEFTPSVTKLDHFSSRSGVRQKDLSVVTEQIATVHVTMEEFSAANMALAMMGTEDPLFSLVTTGTVAATGIISDIASMAGIEEGRLYNIAGPGIPPGASFEAPAEGINQVQLDALPNNAAPTVGTAVALTISSPLAVDIFSLPEVDGSLRFVGTNDVGPQCTMDLPVVSLSPTGNVSMIADAWGTLEFVGDVTAPNGSFGTLYWNTGAAGE